MHGRSKRSDRLVCQCLLVSEGQVAGAIREGARSVAEIGARCEAGTGCTSCHVTLEAMLEAAETRRARAAERRAQAVPQLGLFGAAASGDGDGER